MNLKCVPNVHLPCLYLCMYEPISLLTCPYICTHACLHGCVFFSSHLRLLLQKARGSAPTARVMMKSAKLEWQLSNVPKAIELLETAIESHPEFPKVG